MKKTLWTVGTAVFATMLLSAEPVDVKKLDQTANAATLSERAAFFKANAMQHEAEAERLTNSRNYNPMAAKWPAVAGGPIEYHKQAAMQARRAAAEAQRMAATHSGNPAQTQVSE
ncbi:MAG: hypothetical protein JNL62_14440 [Bryobacterales bacterium]|nr:hypothetical protein [Bryobacterales bacterium]